MIVSTLSCAIIDYVELWKENGASGVNPHRNRENMQNPIHKGPRQMDGWMHKHTDAHPLIVLVPSPDCCPDSCQYAETSSTSSKWSHGDDGAIDPCLK